MNLSFIQSTYPTNPAWRTASLDTINTMMSSSRVSEYSKQRDEGVTLRKKQEQMMTIGERVWFSRYIINGRLQSWAIVLYDTKYGFHRADENEYAPPPDYVQNAPPVPDSAVARIVAASAAGGNPQDRFVADNAMCYIEEEKRQAASARLLMPLVDDYLVCLLGWTALPKALVDNTSQKILTQLGGGYNLSTSKCQDFLRRLGNALVRDHKGCDFDWFLANTQEDQEQLPPPIEMLLVNRDRAKEAGQQTYMIQAQINAQNLMQARIEEELRRQKRR
jgi:hypothetical protein